MLPLTWKEKKQFIQSPTVNIPVDAHGALQGLLDDDHTQYVHKDNARTITAQHTFNPASANPPFILGANAQGQLVTGLNADFLRGLTLQTKHLAGFIQAGGISSGSAWTDTSQTLTLNLPETSSIMAIAGGTVSNATAGNYSDMQLLINGSAKGEADISCGVVGARYGFCLAGYASALASGNRIVKTQIKSPLGTSATMDSISTLVAFIVN